MSYILASSFIGVVIGGIHGGIRYIHAATTKHLQGNEATVYDSGLAARRSLMDKAHLSFTRGFFPHGFKVGFFMLTLT